MAELISVWGSNLVSWGPSDISMTNLAMNQLNLFNWLPGVTWSMDFWDFLTIFENSSNGVILYYFRSKEGSLFTASKFIFKNSFSLLETRTPVLQVLKGTNMATLLQFHWEVQLIKDRQIFIAWLSIVRRREKKLHH